MQPLALDEYEFLRAITNLTAKITLPAPSTMHFYRCDDFADNVVYRDVDLFFADLPAVFKQDIGEFAIGLGAKIKNFARTSRYGTRVSATTARSHLPILFLTRDRAFIRPSSPSIAPPRTSNGADEFELEIGFVGGRKRLQHFRVDVSTKPGAGQGI